MANSSSNNLSFLVIDTSVTINLEASSFAAEILRALGRPVLIVDVVPGELDGGRGYGPKVQAAIADWKRQKLVELVALSDEANITFEEPPRVRCVHWLAFKGRTAMAMSCPWSASGKSLKSLSMRSFETSKITDCTNS